MKTISSLLITLACVTHTGAITIGTFPVNFPGNANDPATGNLYGGVSYSYDIGKFEVTVAQYTAFLNAVATEDVYGLYNTNMAGNTITGISRTGTVGNYSYVFYGTSLYPVNYVSWGDAARFCNWLHNGQSVGLEDANTTERGAYTLDGAISDAALNAVNRNSDAQWFIPSESEWHKAAYYQPAAWGGDTDDYWSYPMRTNTEPYSDQPNGSDAPTQSYTGNFFKDNQRADRYDDGYAVTGESTFNSNANYLTFVGAYHISGTIYDTFDQGGNVSEWLETLITPTERGFRGGSYKSDSSALLAGPGSRFKVNPTYENSDIGFRVARIPEPSTFVLLTIACVGLSTRRRKSNAHECA